MVSPASRRRRGALGATGRGQLVAVEIQGRHRYHRLANPGVARMLEGLMQHASASDWTRRAPRTGPRDEALRQANLTIISPAASALSLPTRWSSAATSRSRKTRGSSPIRGRALF